jgi:hypothetical protein
MSSCNLSMLPLEHCHVIKLAQGLPLLQHLDLSSCKKLQPSMTPQLLQGLASRQLQSLNLQRCFQLTDACLTCVLEYACGSHSSSKALQCIALSHLNLATWPAAADAAAAQIATQHNSSHNTNSNNDREVASRFSSDDGSSQAAATSCDNNRASSNSFGSSGSTAAEWQAVAAGLLTKLPKQLGVALQGAGAASALRVVVLNNCSLLPVQGLVSLAVACPSLEYLILGGSTLKPPALLPAAAADGAAGQGGEAGGVYMPRFAASGGAGGAAPAFEVPAALQQLSELLQLPSSLPWEVLSSCCGAGSCSSGCGQQCCSCPCSCCSQARASAQNMGGAGSEGQDPELERARKRLHRNEPSAAAVATARVHALGLAYVAALLPCLKVLEVSFMAPGLAGWLRVCLDKLHQLRQQQQGVGWSGLGSSSISSMGAVLGGLERVDSSSSSGSARSSSGGSGVVMTAVQQCPKVWQFSCVTSVAGALQTLSDARRASSSSSSSATSSIITSSNGDHGDASSSSSSSNGVSPTCLAMAVRCAVNCSNRGRGTPLHMAADAGCSCHIRALLAAGAAVAARDASGASPLFVACESGQAAAAAVLLEGGADALMGNTAGETPLYIAALRGHLSVVEVLLGHLSAADVDWTQRQLYGDAWTPLMAAAVANRVSAWAVHVLLLGCCGCGSDSEQQLCC